MSRQSLLKDISQTLEAFVSGELEQNAIALFDTLGYRSSRRIEGLQLSAVNLAETFNSQQNLRPAKALTADWLSVHLLFQLTDDEISAAGRGSQLRMVFDSSSKVDASIFRSYLFFAVALRGATYTRGQLATITREVNRLLPIPVMVLFKYGHTLTLAIIHRRPHRRQAEQDVLEKVTLIKDIRVANPHRAHLEILADLALPELYEHHRFTNFLEMHQAWQDTLNISELNKRFYSELANWYFWASSRVTFPEGAGTDVQSRNHISVIRLITRLIFIWFLKELDLIPDELFDHNKLEPILKFGKDHETVYYKAILQNLFFATLSQEMNTSSQPNRRGFRKEPTIANGLTNDFMVHGVFRYKSLFKQPEQILTLFENIPFLNGGLFECLDRKSKNGREVRVDGFSDLPKNPLHVPDSLFFDKEHTEDLNQFYGTKGKRYKVRGLIDLLNHYKFTIEENTPIEEEVALDPELLGKVFENLLAAYNPETQTTARKQTGSFYTPREIVDYMVDETLIYYLQTQLIEKHVDLEDAAIEARLRHLLAYNDEPHQFSPAEVQTLIESIDRIKVLDPAVGSGAFPMGMLHKLVYLLSRLDPHNTGWKERQIQKAREIPDNEIRKQVLEDIEQSFKANELNYGRKLYLIENCIYGVDIQPIAVQIAKLRVFISLVVDQRIDDTKPNRGIRPLPNLETRFVAADSLMSLERPQKTTPNAFVSTSPWPDDSLLIKLGRDLLLVLDQYRKVQSEGVRARYRGFCEEIVYEINQHLENLGLKSHLDSAALLAKAEFNLEVAARELPGYQAPQHTKALILRSSEVEQKENELADVRRRYFTARTYKTKEKYRERDDEIRAELAELLKKTGQLEPDISRKLADWSPYEQNQAADFFDPEWMFGVVQGFDIVLGNPPYVRQEQIMKLKPALQTRYGCYTGVADLYVYFYERGLQLLHPGGLLTFISSNKYFRSAYGEKLRRTIAEKTTILQLIDFGDAPVFSAIAYPSIIITVKSLGSTNIVRALVWQLGQPVDEFVEVFQNKSFLLNQQDLSPTGWRLESKESLRLIQVIQNKGINLVDYVDNRMYRGVVTGYNNAFIIDNSTRSLLISEHPSSAEVIKPFVRGRDIKRWHIDYKDLWIIFTRRGIDISKYPAVQKYLRKFRDNLIPGIEGGRKPGSYQWFEIQDNTAYWQEFDNKQIAWGNLATEPKFSFVDEGYYISAPANTIVSNSKWLLGILNSRILQYVVALSAAERQGGFLEYKPMYVSKLPICEGSSEQHLVLETLVEYLISFSEDSKTESKTSEGIVVQEFEDLLNGLVFELYFPESIQNKGLGVFELADEVLKNGIPSAYKALRDPDSELRARLVRQKIEVEEIRIINEALQK